VVVKEWRFFSRFNSLNIFLTLLLLFPTLTFAASPAGLDFRANFYQRDNARNTLKGRGAAWVRSGTREIFADELEVDLSLNRVFATGNVHIKDGEMNIFCESGNYSLEGGDATLDKATLVFGQTVVSGASISQVGKEEFEVLDGIYTNCNTVPFIDREVSKCPFDVKIYARKFFLTVESYIQIYDAILYTKELPVLYTPYFIAPAKTKRQTGVLVPSLNVRQRLGTGLSLPVFWALGSWHDLTLTPTWWSLIGYHLSLEYRYNYSSKTMGQARLFFLEHPFNSDKTVPWIRPREHRYAGLFSEVAIDLHNQLSLWGRAQSRIDVNLVSNNYWTQDFPNDFGPVGDFQYLRNQVSLTSPSDNTLTTGTAKLNQSVINTRETVADRGSVASSPEIRFYQKNSPSPLNHFYYEFNSRFNNYFRPSSAYDNIPSSRITTNPDLANNDPFSDFSFPLASDSDPGFDSNDYLRTGRRLLMEPRLVANAPLAPGFQLQPVLKAGLLAYHFDLPQPSVVSQSYIDTEIPFALYVSRTYDMDSQGTQKIRHILQPRVLYSASLYKSDTPDHLFFSKAPYPGFTSPRFDSLDDNQEFQYFRFEMINRLLRKSSNDTHRFMLAQVSNNYFLKPSPFNNGEAGMGPLEGFLDLQLGRFSTQIQGTYQLKTINGIHENDWSGTFSYTSEGGDKVSLATLLRKKANPLNDDQTVVLSVYKTLPIYLDVFGSIEHSFKQSITRNYQVGFLFAAKPRNCWSLSFLSGRTVQNEHYARVVFGLSFGGSPTNISSNRGPS